MRDEILIIPKLIIFCCSKRLGASLLFLDRDQVFFLVRRKIYASWMRRVQWNAMNNEIFEDFKLPLLVRT